MVFESVVADLLNKILGDYVENLDKKQLKIGIWGGDVVLHNLKLRENALDDLDLPVQLVYGYLGKLVLKIPWKNLYSQPVVAQIEDLYLLINPKQSVEYDAEKEEKYQLQTKQSALEKLDEAHKLEMEQDKPKPDATFTEKLTAQIVNNLQVKIGNVHLRYEDVTTTGKPFAFGVTLYDLELYTTDVNWEKCYLTEQVSRVYKIASLNSLSAYMNCTAQLFSGTNKENLESLFRENIARRDMIPSMYSYVLGPISSIAKLQLNMNPEYDSPAFVIPKIDLSLEMEKLNIGLTSTQFQDILKLADCMNRMQLGAPYRKFRPFNLPYKNNYKVWWKFAIQAVLEDIRKRNIGWTWEHMKEHRQLCETYAEKLKEKELTKKPEVLLVETCNLLETRLDLFNLILIRKRVQLDLDKIRKEEQSKLTEKTGWFGGWFGGGKKDKEQNAADDFVKKFEAAMTNDEKQKLYAAIGYEENSVPLNMPESYVAINMNFKLIALEVGLYDDRKQQGTITAFDWQSLQTLMLLNFSMATATVRQRPGGNAISVSAGMKEMKLTGLKRTNYTPTIIESKISDEFNLLDIFFETNPLDQLCDQRIKLHARPLQIVYDSDTILKLLEVFTPEQSVNLSELEGAATEKISNFKERSATGMQYIIDKKPILEVDVKFMPNILILPSTGTYDACEKSLIVVTLGQLHIVSQPLRHKSYDITSMPQIGRTTDSILDSISQKAYDRFRISIDDMQVLVTKPHENWEEILVQATKSDMHVLRPTSLIIEADLCVVNDDPRLPKTKINIELPYIYLNITEDRIFEALGVVNSLPRPESAPTEPSPLVRALSSASSKLSLASFLNQDGKKKKKTKTRAESELTMEIVQYTSLDVVFALKEFHITLRKSCSAEDRCITATVESPTDTTYYSTPDEEIPSANDEFQDSSSNHVVTAPVIVTPQEQKILTLQILQLEAHMAQRTYEMVATAKLGAIQLLQYDNWENKETELSVIDTPYFSEELEYLLTVSYTQANKTSPEFISKYNSTEQYILIKFSTLNLILHQECLLHLMEIANTLQKKLEAASPQPKEPQDRIGDADQEGLIDKLATIIEEASEEDEEGASAVAPVSRKQRNSKVVDSIKIHVVANLEQVGLLLTCRKRPLAMLKVQLFDASVILKTSYTELNLRLKNIILNDLNTETIHKNILSIVGNNALNCQVVMYNMDETANYNSDDMKITVEIGCIKIVFLNWFVTALLSFFSHFQVAQEAVANASAVAADAAKQKSLEAYEKATRMKLNIKIKAPIIVVPTDSQSLNGIAIDFGFLMLSNTVTEIRVPKDTRSPAVVDEIKLELKNMKISKVAILQDHEVNSAADEISVLESLDTTDTTYGMKSDVNIMNPMSFTLAVKRNLSSSWYHQIPEIDLSGRLKSIELNLFREDYNFIMSILNCNLNEGQSEFPLPEEVVEIKPIVIPPVDIHQKKSATGSPSRRNLPSSTSLAPTQNKDLVLEQLKFNFQFDGVVVNLMLGENDGLARFGIHILSLKGTKLMNGTLSTSIVLCNIQIDDTRSNSTSKIKKYLCRKDWKARGIENNPNNLKVCETERNYMLDLTAIIKEDDIFAEVRVCGFDLILSIDFLLKLVDFVTVPQEETYTNQEEAQLDAKAVKGKVVKQQQMESTVKRSPNRKNIQPEKKMTLLLHIEEPDIILIESLEDINTNAIIFNMQAQLNYRAIGEKQIINGQIDGMKMYMCSFMPERREATKHYIIHPCVISLQGSTPEEEGLHISLKLSEIIINVSPATIELFNKAMLTINASSAEKEAVLKKEANYSRIWSAQKFFDKDHWFVKVDKAQDVLEELESFEAIQFDNKTEKCVIEVPSITLIIETGIGYYTTPLISIDTQLNAIASNWSRDMSIKGSLSLSMNYFNQTHAVWEPIIEMNERQLENGQREYLPWELNFAMAIESKKSDFEEDVEEKTTTIKIHSEENLELTMSKTCLDLLGVLGEAFSQAIDSKGFTKPEVIAPYVVENDTGFDISINFRHGIFTLHECHMPQATSANTLNHSLVFQTEKKGASFTPEEIQDCTISAGGRAFLQTKNFATLQEEEGEEIYVTIGGIDKEVVLPVSKSDTRYFPLYRGSNQDPWGIVSEVRSEFGTTKINIHGILNVQNHFTTSIQIYRFQASNEILLVGEVPPGQIFHVPLHAIYADHKELYFTVDGYQVSVQGIKWNDSPTDLSYSRQLQCDPTDTFESFYLNVIRTKTEVYHENTNKFMLLSAFYTMHVRPPLYLRNSLPVSITVSVAGCSVRQDESAKKQVSENQLKQLSGKEELLDYGEKEVCPGDVLHLPTFKLSGKSKENRSYLVVRLLQYLEKDWSCTTEVSSDYTDMGIWKFSSYDSSATMDMDLFVRMEDLHGSLIITLYSPFWMINKTGLMLSYKTDTETVDVLYHPPEYSGPILFSFREKFFFDKKAAKIRVDNGDWSDKIPLDVAGSVGEVVCKTVEGVPYRIGVHNHLTHNSLTKQITFIPFYVASNKCGFPIELQEQSRPGDPWSLIKPDMCVPLWPQNDADLMIVAKADGHCTVPFNYSEAQCILLKLENYNYGGINVDVQATEGGVYITFTEYNPGDAPGLLMNHTNVPITYFEKGSEKMCVLSPHEKILYTWNDPNGERTLIFGKERIENDLRRDGVGEMKLRDDSKGYWVSFLDGLQRVLLFTEIAAIATKTETSAALQTIAQSIELRIHGIGLSVLNNETGVDILYLGITSSGVIWEVRKPNKKRFKQMKIHDTDMIETQYQKYLAEKKINRVGIYYLDGKFEIDFDRMILTKSGERLIQRTFYPGVWMLMNTSPFQTQIHAKINKIQIDNQLNDCIFPVVLAPIAPPKSVAATTELKPFVECSIIERVVPNSTVKQYKYATMLIQEFHFKVDLLFLTAIAEYFAGSNTDAEVAKKFNENVEDIEKPLSELVATHSKLEQKNFYDTLHLGPLKIHVSFSMAGSDTTALPGILSTLVQGVGVTLTDVNDVVFRLAYFEREYQFFTQRQLTSEITTHYTGQALKQLYVLVLGLDVLGNPYGLVVGLKKGVQDLFYEPFQGAIQGPGEFAEGLVLGVKSLFGHTVGGAAGAVSKITGAMGKGLAALTFDDEYQKKRRENLNRKPTNFQEGIARSGKSLVMGFVDGVTGVVTKPVAGAKEEGVEGFFKGLGKGAIGFVARPTAGVVDFASGSFAAVKRATECSEEANRLRPPRFLQQDCVLRPYCRTEAEGNKIFREIEKGKFASTDTFVHCEEIVRKHEFVLVSNYRVIYINKNDLFGTWTVQWTYLWHEIASIKSTDRGVEIVLKKEGKKVMGLFSSHDEQRKVILVPQKSRRDELTEIMESQSKET